MEDDLFPGILSPCTRPQARQNLAGRDPNGTHAQVEQKAQAKGKENEWKKKGPKGHEMGYWFLGNCNGLKLREEKPFWTFHFFNFW
jgi:hypothetical protein